MVRILWAVREAAQDQNISIEDLFDLDPHNAENWLE